MKWLKEGMSVQIKNYTDVYTLKEIDVLKNEYYLYNFDKVIFKHTPDEIDWEETAKLNGIPYDPIPSLEEVTKGMNVVFRNGYEDLPSLEEVEKEYAHKHDKGKLQWNLLPINEVEEIVKVFDYGLQKYGKRDSWQLVENPIHRYQNALYRHLVEYLKGNKIDEESGLSHLSHLVTNGLFLMWFENNKD